MDDRHHRTDAREPEEERAVRRLLEAAGRRPPVPAQDLAAITSSLRQAWEERAAPAPRIPAVRARWPLLAALAALLALAVGLGWWWRASRAPLATASLVARVTAVRGAAYLDVPGSEPRALAAGDAVPEGAVVRTDGGEGTPGATALTLAGGIELRLDERSRLRLSTAAEVELLRGAVYADAAAAGGGGALAVRTPLGVARDVGTQFAVRLEGPRDRAMRVTVREGLVMVERDRRSWEVAAGEELTVPRHGATERRAVPPHGPVWDWVLAAAPPFVIEGESLAALLGWVARETGWQVRYAEPSLAAAAEDVVLHGDLGGLRPDQAPFAVLPGAGFAGEVAEGVLVVRRAP